MTDVEKKGILSFFQNVGNSKPGKSEKEESNQVKHTKPIEILEDGGINKRETIVDLEYDEEEFEPVTEHDKKALMKVEMKTEDLEKEELEKDQLNEKETDKEEPSKEKTNKEDIKKEDIKKDEAKNEEAKNEEAKKEDLKKDQLKKEKEAKRLERLEEQRKQKELKQKLRDEEKRKREEERLKLKQQRLDEQKKQKELKQKQRDEEKRKRDEEKRKKEEEKLKLRQQREDEKRKKEEEKLKKEEAKERAQSRIGNFFKKASSSQTTAFQKSDYQKSFLPFYAKDTVSVSKNLILSKSDLINQKDKIDSFLASRNEPDDDSVLEWLDSMFEDRGHNIKYKAVTLLQQMTSKNKTDEELQALLSLIPHKYIKFYENVRPPFIGTYSKDIILPVDDPCSTKDTGFNYEYDSDLEWINDEDEDADGAGIDNLESGDEDDDDEEDEEEEGSEGEFDGFLDAEDASNQAKDKKKFIGPLIPTLCLRTNLTSVDEEDRTYFNSIAAEYLIAAVPFPIDPFALINIPNKAQEQREAKRALEQTNPNNLEDKTDNMDVKKQKSIIIEPKDLLRLFDEIQDSTFSLGTVTEIAQKSLPHYNKQTIKNTVKEYASRSSGKGDTPRKWEIKDINQWNELKTKIQPSSS